MIEKECPKCLYRWSREILNQRRVRAAKQDLTKENVGRKNEKGISPHGRDQKKNVS